MYTLRLTVCRLAGEATEARPASVGERTEDGMRDEIIEQLAQRLDVVYPGWAQRIDPASLDMSSCTACIIGQAMRATDDSYNRGYSWRQECERVVGSSFDSDDPRFWRFSCQGYAVSWMEAIADRVCRSEPAHESHEAVDAVARGVLVSVFDLSG